MSKILSVSYDIPLGQPCQSLLERNGYTVIPAAKAKEATALIRTAKLDAILLGSVIPIDDRAALATLGIKRNIPVICLCGIAADNACPVVHVSPSEPKQLLSALAQLLGVRRARRAIGM